MASVVEEKSVSLESGSEPENTKQTQAGKIHRSGVLQGKEAGRSFLFHILWDSNDSSYSVINHINTLPCCAYYTCFTCIMLVKLYNNPRR